MGSLNKKIATMWDFVYEYLGFLVKIITLVIAIIVAISFLASCLAGRRGRSQHGHLEVRKINDRLESHRNEIQHAVLPPAEFKKYLKQQRKRRKASRNQVRKRIFLLDFKGNLQAGGVMGLTEEINAILTSAESDDQVVVRVASAGGRVDSYGLAAAQLQRLRDRGLHLVVAVDNVAASGGYLMACPANTIIAAPFAIVGSIGVVAEIPNFHRLLQKNDIDFDIYKSGEFKRTVTIFGENTEEGKEKFTEELHRVHEQFKSLVFEHRPNLDIDRVSTGEAWVARDALEMGLVDELLTSDAYLLEACKEADIYQLCWVEKLSPMERMMRQIGKGIHRVMNAFRTC